MSIIIFYNRNYNNRLRYVLDFVFKKVLNLSYELTSDYDFFIQSKKAKIYYGNKLDLDDSIYYIFEEGLLHEQGVRFFDIQVGKEFPYNLYFNDKKDVDFFSSIFFCLTRYEEYWNSKKDGHGRFQAKNSVLFKNIKNGPINNLIQIPIVDVWIDLIRKTLNEKNPNLSPIALPSFNFIPTYDIDHVRAFQWKGAMRTLGAFLKDIFQANWNVLNYRFKVLLNKRKDPYDVFEEWNSLEKKYKLHPIYFWLIGDYSQYDKNPNYKHRKFKKQIINSSKSAKIGLHISYKANGFLNKMKNEKNRIETIINKNVDKNRFHFLKFALPFSYQQLLKIGIKEDYSMAYAECIGFRAGTSHSYNWFDLEKNESTSLMIFPYCIMDVSLKNYMKLKPNEAIDLCEAVLDEIRKNGGNFIILWHNSSYGLSTWKEWEGMYQKILERAFQFKR